MKKLARRTPASRAKTKPRLASPAWKIIVFVKGQRITKNVRDPKEGLLKVSSLIKQGYKAHLVSRRRAFFPHIDDDLSAMNDGMMWCPYCRRWRWFAIPNWTPDAEINTEAWFLNSYANQEIACCRWCTISTNDWHVRYMNGLKGDEGRRHRRRRRGLS